MSRSEVALLLAEVQRRGVTLAVQKGRLLFRPREAVPPDLLVGMSGYKAELIALLSPGTEGAFSETPLGGTDITDKSPDSQLLSVMSVPLGAGQPSIQHDNKDLAAGVSLAPLEGMAIDKATLPGFPSEGSVEASVDPFLARVLETFPGSTVVAEDEPPWETASIFDSEGQGPCWACGGKQRWRLREGLPWVCSRCHPSPYPADQVEWLLPDAGSDGGDR